jgi:hypothetical protein
MDHIGPGVGERGNLFTQAGKISGKNRRGNQHPTYIAAFYPHVKTASGRSQRSTLSLHP